MRVIFLLSAIYFCAYSFASLAQVSQEDQVSQESVVVAKKTRTPAKYCDITGQITDLHSYIDTPWNGVPTALSETRVLISINVNSRSAHEKNDTKGQEYCGQGALNKVFSYKLCSNTPIKRGDRVSAVEGTDTGSKKSKGCLFDLVVLPKTNQ